MNMQALRGVDQLGGEPIADDAFEQDGAGDIGVRAARAAGVAAANATDVDRHGRFPREAFEVIKTQRLLSLGVPKVFGGDGAPIGDLADVCYTLGKACSSTRMIYAMHQTKVACIVRHGRGQAWHEALMRAIARDQLLLASSTTEGNNGGERPLQRRARRARTATRIDARARRDGHLLRGRGRRPRHDGAPLGRCGDLRPGSRRLPEKRLHARAAEWLGHARHAGHLQLGLQAARQGLGSSQILPERYETIHARP